MTHTANPSPSSPDPLWIPDPTAVADSPYGRFARFVDDRHRIGLPDTPDHEQLWRWSTTNLEQFWEAVWEFFDVQSHSPWERVLSQRTMPGAQWFTGATVNYAENILSRGDDDAQALVCIQEDGSRETVTWSQLRRRTANLAAVLRNAGVGTGDRVVGCLPAGPHAVVGLLAAASIGAIWAQCAPDLAAPAVLDRFQQLEPTVLIATDSATHKGKRFDRRAEIAAITAQMPTLTRTIVVEQAKNANPAAEAPKPPKATGASGTVESAEAPGASGTVRWDDVVVGDSDLTFQEVPFEHPLWVLFSSGTTGAPKGIVHSHGGVVLSLLSLHGLHLDVRKGDRLFWYSSTTWVMWNVSVSALLTGATVVIYDGSPLHPDAARLWQIAADERVTHLGTSPGHLLASERAGLVPREQFDLSALRIVGSTGSPLPSASYHWVHDQVGERIQLSSITGGTDAVIAFAGSSPATPVWPGEISARTLGVAMESWSADGEAQVDVVGELVLTAPMPSMPVSFWNDSDGSRYQDAYFTEFPGIWRHGDWVTVTDRGSIRMHGRSDATLNRNGIRLGSAEIYSAVDGIAQIADSVVVGIELEDGGYWMPLFVQLSPGAALDDELIALVRETIQHRASARHVPDEIIPVPAVPHTRTGKRIEVPLKRILQGADPHDVVSVHALDAPEALEPFLTLARTRG